MPICLPLQTTSMQLSWIFLFNFRRCWSLLHDHKLKAFLVIACAVEQVIGGAVTSSAHHFHVGLHSISLCSWRSVFLKLSLLELVKPEVVCLLCFFREVIVWLLLTVEPVCFLQTCRLIVFNRVIEKRWFAGKLIAQVHVLHLNDRVCRNAHAFAFVLAICFSCFRGLVWEVCEFSESQSYVSVPYTILSQSI